VFHNQGAADTVRLTDASGTTLATLSTPAGNTAYRATVAWNLTAGTTYRLLSDSGTNGRWVSYTAYPSSNSQIAVDGVYGMGMLHPIYWFSFLGLQTCDR